MSENYYKIDIGDGKRFAKQRQALDNIIAHVATCDITTAFEDRCLEGIRNLLDEILDQAHDHFGIDCSYNTVPVYNPDTDETEAVNQDLYTAWQEEVAANDTVLGFMEWRDHRIEDGSICRECGDYQGGGWGGEGFDGMCPTCADETEPPEETC